MAEVFAPQIFDVTTGTQRFERTLALNFRSRVSFVVNLCFLVAVIGSNFEFSSALAKEKLRYHGFGNHRFYRGDRTGRLWRQRLSERRYVLRTPSHRTSTQVTNHREHSPASTRKKSDTPRPRIPSAAAQRTAARTRWKRTSNGCGNTPAKIYPGADPFEYFANKHLWTSGDRWREISSRATQKIWRLARFTLWTTGDSSPIEPQGEKRFQWNGQT